MIREGGDRSLCQGIAVNRGIVAASASMRRRFGRGKAEAVVCAAVLLHV